MRGLHVAGVLLAVSALVPACSGDDGGQAADLQDRSFCELQERIDNRLLEAFGEVGPDADEAAFAEAIQDAADELRGDGVLEAAAAAVPSEIAGPARTYVAALEAAADGDTEALDRGDAPPARAVVDEHCFGAVDDTVSG